MVLTHIAARAGRLSSFLKGEMRMSTGLMNKLKWGSAIRVNGLPRHTDYPVSPGDCITVELDEEKPQYPAQRGQLRVLFEDEHLLAVEKPAGMLIHPSHSCNTGTLANLVLGYYEEKDIQAAFHPITRLDRDTFGVVLLAKNAYVHALLNELHNAGELEKTYHALCFGCPPLDSGIIDAPIARLALPSLLRTVSPEGKKCVTEYRVLERKAGISKLALRPVTGRTHQLRVHCAYMGFPILGDPQYGSEDSQTLSRQMGLSYQMLCAKSIAFPHPITGERLCIVSQMDV